MEGQDLIKQAMERNIKAVTLRPSIGLGAEVMRFEMREDGSCKVAEGDRELIIDLGEYNGGKGTTPNPGFYVRAAFGACLAQGYLMWASYHGVPVDRLGVEVHTEYDMRGGLAIDESVTANYTACRYIVEVESPAPREKVLDIIERADAVDFMRCLFAEETALEREVRIVESQSATS